MRLMSTNFLSGLRSLRYWFIGPTIVPTDLQERLSLFRGCWEMMRRCPLRPLRRLKDRWNVELSEWRDRRLDDLEVVICVG